MIGCNYLNIYIPLWNDFDFDNILCSIYEFEDVKDLTDLQSVVSDSHILLEPCTESTGLTIIGAMNAVRYVVINYKST